MKLNPLYPTTVIGSLPRPQWVIELVNELEAGQIGEAEFNRALDAAAKLV